jgi:hypothetical protein
MMWRPQAGFLTIRGENPGEFNLDLAVVDTFHNTTSTTALFDEVFPLKGNLGKMWKGGVRFWPTTNFSKIKRTSRRSLALDTFIERMLKAGIISTTTRGPFVSSVFLVPKDETKARFIADFSHLTKKLVVPNMILPNLFQIVRRKDWPLVCGI